MLTNRALINDYMNYSERAKTEGQKLAIVLIFRDLSVHLQQTMLGL